MSRSPANAAAAVERFFQFALWGLVVSGYLAVAGSGYLDAPTVLLTGAGLLVRALLISGALRLTISPRLVLALTLAYVGFFPLDYFFLSRAFIQSTVHLVFFLAVIQILTSRTNRDYFFMATIAFLELLAAAILSSNSNFFLFLTLYLLFAMAAFTSSEIRRSMQKRLTVARSGSRRFHWRLAALTAVITMGILGLTTGLFFILPRTDAALRRLVSHRYYLPGFSNQVLLGEIGEIKSTSRPVMHVQFNLAPPPPNLKWRGATLSDFNGRAWFEPPTEPRWIAPVAKGEFQLATAEQRRRNGAGRELSGQPERPRFGRPVLRRETEYGHCLAEAAVYPGPRGWQLPAGTTSGGRILLRCLGLAGRYGRRRGFPWLRTKEDTV